MCEPGQYENFCKDEFDKICKMLGRLDEAIRGNGKPGINTRLDRLEQSGRRQARVIWLVVGVTVSLTLTALWKAAWGG